MARHFDFLPKTLSATGHRWSVAQADAQQAEDLARAHDLPVVAGNILLSRGITPQSAGPFLNPTVRDLMRDPFTLRDMETAVHHLVKVVKDGAPLGIVGDYDVDGATSCSVIQRYIQACGGTVHTYIPDRLKEGYGPNITAFETLKDKGCTTVVTVDCGITAGTSLAHARDLGIKVIVVDHHQVDEAPPPALAVINPKRPDDDSAQTMLAAVGVVFFLVVALHRALKDMQFFTSSKPAPDLLQFLDMVALGTVCDMVPLTGVNRAFVRQGLQVMGYGDNKGLQALKNMAGLSKSVSVQNCAFMIGPRINAAGRVGESGLGVRLLTTQDYEEAKALAFRLDKLNQTRRALESHNLHQAKTLATTMMEKSHNQKSQCLLLADKAWHAGVTGLVAGHLSRKFHRPAVVVALDEDGLGKGSARSVNGIDIGAALLQAKHQGLIVSGGGHAMAGGLTVHEDNLDALRSFLNETLAQDLSRLPTPQILCDGVLALHAVTPRLYQALHEKIGPFGMGHREPCFIVPSVRVQDCQILGQDHIRCRLDNGEGHSQTAVAWRAFASDLGSFLRTKARQGDKIHVVGTLQAGYKSTSTVQFSIEDASQGYAVKVPT